MKYIENGLLLMLILGGALILLTSLSWVLRATKASRKTEEITVLIFLFVAGGIFFYHFGFGGYSEDNFGYRR